MATDYGRETAGASWTDTMSVVRRGPRARCQCPLFRIPQSHLMHDHLFTVICNRHDGFWISAALKPLKRMQQTAGADVTKRIHVAVPVVGWPSSLAIPACEVVDQELGQCLVS